MAAAAAAAAVTNKTPKPKGTKAKTFASSAKNLASSGHRSSLVEARGQKKIVPVTGRKVKSDDDDLEGVAPFVRDYWDISVSRLSEAVTADKVKTHLHKHGIEVKDVFILSSKIKGTKAAKVRVVREHKNRVKVPDIWPEHCKVADWINFKKRPKPANATGSGNEVA